MDIDSIRIDGNSDNGNTDGFDILPRKMTKMKGQVCMVINNKHNMGRMCAMMIALTSTMLEILIIKYITLI